jgi:hypothetical protein
LGEPHVAVREEFDDDFSATDICVEVSDGGAGVITRDSSESDLPDTPTPHDLKIKPRLRFVNTAAERLARNEFRLRCYSTSLKLESSSLFISCRSCLLAVAGARMVA